MVGLCSKIPFRSVGFGRVSGISCFTTVLGIPGFIVSGLGFVSSAGSSRIGLGAHILLQHSFYKESPNRIGNY